MNNQILPWLLLVITSGAYNARAAEGDVDPAQLTNAMYQKLLTLADKCEKNKLPSRIEIVDSPYPLAQADLDSAHSPRITVTQGLIDRDVLLALYSVNQNPAGFEVIAESASDPPKSLRDMNEWKAWSQRPATPIGWRERFESRVAFALAHELAHHCLGHVAKLNGVDARVKLKLTSGDEVDDWEPRVMLSHADYSAPDTDDKKARRALEEAADTWAVKLLLSNTLQWHLELEAMGSAAGEIALVDAIHGFKTYRDPFAQWAHPMGRDRFEEVYRQLMPTILMQSSFGYHYRYFGLVKKMIDCIEPAKDKVRTYRSFINHDPDLPCVADPLIAQVDIKRTLLQPPIRKTGAGQSVTIVMARGVVPTIRRAGTSRALARVGLVEARVGENVKWQIDVDQVGSYKLKFQKIPASGDLSILLDGEVAVKGHFENGSLVRDEGEPIARLSAKNELSLAFSQ